MAKDPAMLWYWSDWNSGTVTLMRLHKGAYMDVLHAQFHNGHLSLDEIRAVLGTDFETCWPVLEKKFKKDEKGLFFNQRLEIEKERRKSFTESRRKNLTHKVKHKEPHKASHMDNHMENENRNRNEDVLGIKKSESFDELFLRAFDEITCERLKITFSNIPDLGRELQIFRTKCDNSPEDYHSRDVAGLRAAFQYQLKNYKHGKGKRTTTPESLSAAVDEALRSSGIS